jgi:hypothetical protein
MAFESLSMGNLSLDSITLAAFSAANGMRLVAYIPQIRKAARDLNGASAISYTTWSLFLMANISTVAYAIVNRGDVGLALCFAGNAVCCLAILGVAFWKRRGYVRRLAGRGRATPVTAS